MKTCTVCQQEFETKEELQQHLTAVHPEAADKPLNEDDLADNMDETREQTDAMVEEGERELEGTPTV